MPEILRKGIDFGVQVGEFAPPEAGRVPPQAVDIEAQVLGAMLIEKEAIPKALEILDEDSFYKDAHKKIFRAIISLFEKNEPADTVTVVEELRRRGQLEEVGGAYYLTDLTSKVVSSANIESHARIVLEKALLRSLISSSSEIAARAFHQAEDALELLDEAEQRIFQISERRLRKGFIPLKKLAHNAFEVLAEMHGKHSGITGIASGFRDLDNLTGGFQRSDLIIIAGRPSMGKTAFALSIGRNAALKENVPVGFFSLEMSNFQLVLRLLSAEAQVNLHQIRTGRMTDEEWQRLSMKVGRLVDHAKIFIDDSASLGILELRAKARRLKAEHNVGMIVVDYLQLMQGPKKVDTREQEISMISRSLKSLAKELDIPVVALSQLRRAVEERGGKRPILSDLRESGAIEQDADVVIFVHRPEIYKDPYLSDGKTPSEGLAEIILAKQRNGPTDDIRLAFLKEYPTFVNLALREEAPVPPLREEETPF